MTEQIVAVEEVLLEVARPELYRLNAFRITELPVDAEARDVSRRQTTIKQASNTSLPVPAGYSRALPLEGQPDPDTLSVAFQRLGDPERRLVDELFWFWPRQFGKSRSDEALTTLARGGISTVSNHWRQQQQNPDDGGKSLHNLAVLSHASALDWEHIALSRQLSNQEQMERDSRWQEAFKYWTMLVEDEAFWSRVTGRIRDLDDPRLTTGMARRIRINMPQTLLSINGQLAVRAAERNNIAECRRQVALMRKSGFDQQAVDDALRRAVEPIRERIKTLCKMVETQASSDPTKADSVTTRFLDQSQSPLAILDNLLPPGNATRDAMHDEVAQHALVSLVTYGNKTENWPIVLPLVDRILPLAAGAALRARIQDNRTSAQNNLTLAACWYCQKKLAQPAHAHQVKMYGNVRRTYYYRRKRVEWQNVTIHVGRCQECQALHSRARVFTYVGGTLGIALGLLLGIMITAAIQSIFGLVILFFLTWALGAGAINLGIMLDTRFFLSPKNVRAVRDIKTFPAVKTMLSQGWKIGAKPST